MDIKVTRFLTTKFIAVVLVFLSFLTYNLFCIIVTALLINLFLLWFSRKNKFVFLLFAVLFFISFNFINAFYINTDNIIYINNLYVTKYYYDTLLSYLLFILSVFIFFNFKNLRPLRITYFDNDLIFYGFLFVSLFALLFGVNRDKTGGYNVNITTIYELLYLFIFFSLLFSGGQKHKISLVVIFSLVAIFQDLYYDGRITSLQIILLYIIFFIDKIQLKHIIIIGVGCLIVFAYIGQIRMGGDVYINIFDSFFKIDTFYFAYQASETHLYAADKIDSFSKLSSFIGYFLNVIFIDNGKINNVSAISHNYAFHYYGGYIFTWFYFWFGYLGSFLIGGVISKIICFNLKRNKISNNAILCLIFATLPRWYIYEPISLFKYAMLIPWIFFVIYFTVTTYLKINNGLKLKDIDKSYLKKDTF